MNSYVLSIFKDIKLSDTYLVPPVRMQHFFNIVRVFRIPSILRKIAYSMKMTLFYIVQVIFTRRLGRTTRHFAEYSFP